MAQRDDWYIPDPSCTCFKINPRTFHGSWTCDDNFNFAVFQGRRDVVEPFVAKFDAIRIGGNEDFD